MIDRELLLRASDAIDTLGEIAHHVEEQFDPGENDVTLPVPLIRMLLEINSRVLAGQMMVLAWVANTQPD